MTIPASCTNSSTADGVSRAAAYHFLTVATLAFRDSTDWSRTACFGPDLLRLVTNPQQIPRRQALATSPSSAGEAIRSLRGRIRTV